MSDEVDEIIGDEGLTDAVVPQRVQPVDLQMEMQRSYLDYAMSVIVGRALPDVRDGPVVVAALPARGRTG